MSGTVELVESFHDLQEAEPDYIRADEFYNGEVSETFASAKVKRLLAKAQADELDDFGYAKIPVDVVAGKLRILSVVAVHAEPPEQEIPREQDTVLQHAQDLIQQIIQRNQFMAEYVGAHLDVCKFGDAYPFVWPVTDDQGVVTDVDVFMHSPYTVRAFYGEENPLQVSHVIKAWDIEIPPPDDPLGKPEKRRRANLYYRDRIEKWITVPGRAGKLLEDWEPYEETNPTQDDDNNPTTDSDPGQLPPGHEIPNPYDQIPFFHLRNNRPYGTPRHRPAYGPQLVLNKLVSSHMVTIDYQSFPQRYALMDPKQDDPLANFVDPINPEDDDDDPEGDHNASQLRSDPAAVWRLRGMSSVGQFSAADPDVFLAPFDRYVKAMSELTGIPLYKFGTSFAQPPSGTALAKIDAPVDEEAEQLQDRLGSVWADAFEFALRLLGVEGIQVEVKWKPVRTVTDQEGWQTLGLKIASGVTVRQALLEAGYTSEQVDQMLPDDATQDLIRQVQMLNQIGTAVQSLGAGVGLGVLSQEQAAAAVQRVLALGELQGGAPDDRLALPPERYGSVRGKTELLEPKDPNPPPPAPPGQPPPRSG
jgi:hypothetical protein